MEIKFCGTTSTRDINMAQASGASEVGIIWRPDSRPYQPQPWKVNQTVGAGQAQRLTKAAQERKLTAVLLPHSNNFREILTIAELVQPDRIQLGETADKGLNRALSELPKPPVVAQVVHVSPSTRPELIDSLLDYADVFHFDSAGKDPGGNGLTHNWEISAEMAERVHAVGKLAVLSGGLAADNVAEAIAIVKPDVVDVQSGIKCAYGTHNFQLGREFVSAVQEAIYG